MCARTSPGVNEMSADPYVTSVEGTQFTPNYDPISGIDEGPFPKRRGTTPGARAAEA